jgi:hypothetical protein
MRAKKNWSLKRSILLLTIFIIALVPLVSSCTGGAEQLYYWAKLWALTHDITGEDGSPNYLAIGRFAAVEVFGVPISTGDEEADAVIDSAHILKDIRDADKEAKTGWTNLYAEDNVEDSVIPHYNSAIKTRPNDWAYRNERGIAYLQYHEITNQAEQAKKDFDEAAALAKKSKQPDEYLKMLKDREQKMSRLNAKFSANGGIASRYFYEEQARVYNELYKLTNQHDYLLLKQQAEANVTLGWYKIKA